MLSLRKSCLSSQFIHWLSASAVMTFQGLCDLIMLEQFKDTILDCVATYINERFWRMGMFWLWVCFDPRIQSE